MVALLLLVLIKQRIPMEGKKREAVPCEITV